MLSKKYSTFYVLCCETKLLLLNMIFCNRTSWGAFLGELINFIIIAFVVFIIAKKFLKEEKVEIK